MALVSRKILLFDARTMGREAQGQAMAVHGRKLADGVMDNPHGPDHPAKAARAELQECACLCGAPNPRAAANRERKWT
jgi:hypothetical protein